MGRIFRRFFRLIERSWHMYPLGVLFGLGFDTATEVGLLGISATQAAQGLSIWSILVFPALFTAGMSLMDTTDSILMLGAYGWAFVKPIRKLYYNLTITAVSVIVAVVVGGLEALNLIGDQLGLTDGGGFWGAIGAINDNFGMLGYIIVGIFVVSWLVSFLVYRAKRYDEIEVGDGLTSRLRGKRERRRRICASHPTAIASPAMVPFGDQKGTRCGASTLQSRGCPRNCKRRAPPFMTTGKPGRSASGVDPRARRPAIARAADLGRGEPCRVDAARARGRAVFRSNACEGVMPEIRLPHLE